MKVGGEERESGWEERESGWQRLRKWAEERKSKVGAWVSVV